MAATSQSNGHDESSESLTEGVNGSAPGASKTSGDRDEKAYDRALILRAAKGDTRAFRELVERHQRRAHAVAYGIVRNVDDAREVTQDAFMRVYRHLDDFEGQASFSTWLYRIVVNLSIDALRRRHPGRHVELDERTDLDGTPGEELLPYRGETNPFARLDQRRLAEAMQAALEQLPVHHRTVILLREVEGLSYEEIAEAVQIPKGTVMSRLFHARRKMQELLRAKLGDEAPTGGDGEEGGA